MWGERLVRPRSREATRATLARVPSPAAFEVAVGLRLTPTRGFRRTLNPIVVPNEVRNLQFLARAPKQAAERRKNAAGRKP